MPIVLALWLSVRAPVHGMGIRGWPLNRNVRLS